MNSRPKGTRWRLPFAVALIALCGLFCLNACMTDNVAVGSSEVDNPQIMVAFVDTTGMAILTTGSLGIYLADQSPALNPDPLVEIQLTGTAVCSLSAATLAAAGLTDSARSYNLYYKGNDSTGSFLQNISYDPVTKTFSRPDSAAITGVRLTLTPLIRSESVVKGGASDSTGVNRVIIPGSPFQAVLVDSVFVFEEIPSGVYTVHVVTPGGAEIPLPEQVDTEEPKYHNYNPDTVPVVRPPPPPPTVPLIAKAGEDRTVYVGFPFNLDGDVRGADRGDRKLAVLWRQLPPSNSEAVAILERPSSLRTNVYFPRPGAYTFVLSLAFGAQQVQDTVVIGVQAAPENPTFIEPSEGDTVRLGRGYKIVWQGPRQETLSLEFSRDSGATWEQPPIKTNISSRAGFNEFFWSPGTGIQPSTHCMLRLMRGQTVATVSPRFVLRQDSGPGGPGGGGGPDHH